MNIPRLKRLVQLEIALRPFAGDASEEWTQAIQALRESFPDWPAVVLELISENERLKAELPTPQGAE